MLADASFLLLGAAAGREIVAGRKWGDLGVVILVVVMPAGNVRLFHFEAHFNGAADIGIRAGIAIVVMLISLIGGRIVPSFTRNWLARENPGRLPAPFARFDMLVVAIGALVLALWIVRPSGAAVGGRSRIGRMSTFHSHGSMGRRPHLARAFGAHSSHRLRLRSGWISAECGIDLDLVPADAGIHAWMVGSAGS